MSEEELEAERGASVAPLALAIAEAVEGYANRYPANFVNDSLLAAAIEFYIIGADDVHPGFRNLMRNMLNQENNECPSVPSNVQLN